MALEGSGIGGTVQDPQIDFFMGAGLVVVFAVCGVLTIVGMFFVGMKSYLLVALTIEVAGLIAGLTKFRRSIVRDEPNVEPEHTT